MSDVPTVSGPDYSMGNGPIKDILEQIGEGFSFLPVISNKKRDN